MDTSPMLSQVVIAYLATRLIEALKRWSGLPFMTAGTDKINKVVGAFIALLATIGITVATSWESSTGTLAITVSGLTIGNALGFAWHWLQQFVLQQAAYHGIVKGEVKQ